jgi:lipopolysaccharide transport system ATP-binding protein
MPSNPEIVLSIKNVNKHFLCFEKPSDKIFHFFSGGSPRYSSKFSALKDISFEMKAGETLGIMGRNGSGKTTLLSLIAGILTQSSGTIMKTDNVGALISLGAGFNPELNGIDNIRQLGMLQQGGPFSDDEESWIESFSELGASILRPVKTYSQGMLLRLGFAVSTARRPRLLIIDEVMAVGDFFFRVKCHNRIKQFVHDGTAVVLVSHDYTEIVQFCEKAIVLERGCINYYGNASDAANIYLSKVYATPQQVSGKNDGSQSAMQANREIVWPSNRECIPLLDGSLSNKEVELMAIACCDSTLSQRWIFTQGDRASIYVKFIAKVGIAVPTVTVLLSDERGILIHGNSSHMKCLDHLPPLSINDVIECKFMVQLDLRFGEYQLDVAIGDINEDIYRTRSALSFEELGSQTRLIARYDRLGIIAVTPRQTGIPTQLTHHGLVNLPSEITVSMYHMDKSYA